jgi:lysophospholipid acyltransferase
MSIPIPHPLVPDFVIELLRNFGFRETGRALAPAIFVVLTISTWPIALATRYMTSPFLRMLLSLVVGIGMTIGVYGYEMASIFLVTIISFYVPCRYRVVGPGTITLIALLALGFVHYDSMITGTATDRMSHTGTLMVMVAKISMFAFHFNDGFKRKSGLSLSEHPHIAAQRNLSAVEDVSLFKFIVYTCEFQGSMVGPLFTYAEYMDFVYNRGDFKIGQSIPYIVPSLKSAGRAFAILGSYIFLSKQWWFGADFLVSDWFQSLPFYQQLFFAPFIVASCRMAYYAVWSLSEVACTLSGLSFMPPLRFTRGRNVNLRQFEFSSNFNSVTNNWNIRISDLWLKQSIYQRVEEVPAILRPFVASRKGLANFTTKATSAFWHGWYAGYGISFLSLGLCNWSETLLRKKLHPRLPAWLCNNALISVLAWMQTWWSVNLFFAPFVLLTWAKTSVFYGGIFWCGHLYHLVLILVCSVLPTPKTASGKHDKAE